MTIRPAMMQEYTYFGVMRIEKGNPDFIQCDWCEKLSSSVGGLICRFKELMANRFVKMKSFANSKDKFGRIDSQTPTRMSQKATTSLQFMQCNIDRCETLKTEIEALKSEFEIRGELGPANA